MMKKFWILSLFILITSISVGAGTYSSKWIVNGISPDGGLMIVYKSLAPLSLTIEDPEIMRISKSSKKFKYSDVTNGHPLKVVAQTKYNTTLDNKTGKDIIRTIYNSVQFSFDSLYTSGVNNFKLDYFPQKGEDHSENEKIKKYINGRAFFTDLSGRGESERTEVSFEDNIATGTLLARTYIDAEFNVPDEVQLLGGETYRGVLRVKAEFLGKNPLQ